MSSHSPDTTNENNDIALLKNKYRAEYAQRVKNKITLFDILFKNKEQRFQKLDRLIERQLERDAAKGVLQARHAADERARVAETARDIPQVAPVPHTAKEPDTSDPETHRQPPHIEISLPVPNVPVLQGLPDDDFLKYVFNRLQRHSLRDPSNAVNTARAPFLLLQEMKFEIIPAADGGAGEDDIRRTPDKTVTMLLCYGPAEERYIQAASQVLQSYNAHGRIGLRTRENYILEEMEDIIRTAGHPLTSPYLIYCERLRSHIAMQMQTFDGGARNSWEQPKQTNVSVRYGKGSSTLPSRPKP